MSEKQSIIAGLEFGDRNVHTLIIYKLMYSLTTSELRWHERFAVGSGYLACCFNGDIVHMTDMPTSSVDTGLTKIYRRYHNPPCFGRVIQ